MKIRTSFVSNSSSSSFIISNNESKEIVKQLLMDNGYDYYELDGVLYTSFIGDCSDLYSEIYNLTIDDTIDGSHDFPYDEDNFFELHPGSVAASHEVFHLIADKIKSDLKHLGCPYTKYNWEMD